MRSADDTQWIAAFRKALLGQAALASLRELDQGDMDAYMALETRVLQACFHAHALANTPFEDDFEKLFRSNKDFREAIDDLGRCAQRLGRAAKAHPLLFGTSLGEAKERLHLSQEERVQGPFGIANAFGDLMDKTIDGLHRMQGINPYGTGSIAGCLDYGTDIRSGRSADHSLNSLIFELALIFRHWTASLDEDAPAAQRDISIPSSMPAFGRPHFQVISKFALATFNHRISEQAVAPQALADRLKKMLRNYPSLQYVGWG